MTVQKVWFPLRSNLAYFQTTGPTLDLEARIKLTCLLADELLFEPGALDVSMGEHGGMALYIPPGSLDEATVRARQQRTAPGRPFALLMAPEKSPGGPIAGPFVPIVGGPLDRGFFAEYQLFLCDRGLDRVPWINFCWPERETIAAADRAARDWDHGERLRRDLPRLTENTFLNNQLRKDLNRDLALAGVMGLTVAVDPLRRPLLDFRRREMAPNSEKSVSLGGEALSAWIPDFSKVPWPDIVALHDHEAIGGFRAKLIEAEETVSTLPSDQRREALLSIGLHGALDRVAALAPTLSRSGVEVGSSIAIDVLAGGVPLASTVVGTTREVAKLRRHQGEWTTLLLTLRDRATRGAD